jgi:hypothetical protein
MFHSWQNHSIDIVFCQATWDVREGFSVLSGEARKLPGPRERGRAWSRKRTSFLDEKTKGVPCMSFLEEIIGEAGKHASVPGGVIEQSEVLPVEQKRIAEVQS